MCLWVTCRSASVCFGLLRPASVSLGSVEQNSSQPSVTDYTKSSLGKLIQPQAYEEFEMQANNLAIIADLFFKYTILDMSQPQCIDQTSICSRGSHSSHLKDWLKPEVTAFITSLYDVMGNVPVTWHLGLWDGAGVSAPHSDVPGGCSGSRSAFEINTNAEAIDSVIEQQKGLVQGDVKKLPVLHDDPCEASHLSQAATIYLQIDSRGHIWVTKLFPLKCPKRIPILLNGHTVSGVMFSSLLKP